MLLPRQRQAIYAGARTPCSSGLQGILSRRFCLPVSGSLPEKPVVWQPQSFYNVSTAAQSAERIPFYYKSHYVPIDFTEAFCDGLIFCSIPLLA